MATAPETDPDTTPDERAKPPFLRRVRIRGYKSIAFCDVTLEPLTILVGRNASGKSNFVDALAFLADLADMRATEAVDRRSGWSAIHCRASAHAEIEMGIEATLAGYEPALLADLSFALAPGPHGQVEVLRERLLLSEIGGDRQCGYRAVNGRVEWLGREHDWTLRQGYPNFPPSFFGQHSQDRLLLSVIGSQPIVELGEEFRASHTHNFSASAMRGPKPITSSPYLVHDGSNLARAIEGIREIDPDLVSRIGRYLSAIVDDIESFDTVQYDDHETVQFQVPSGSGSPQRYTTSNMSDGTLRALAALVAAFQIYLPTNASGFTAIEEPETSLHPAAMRALVAALDEATLRTQILLTTHSPELLDTPEIKPENVRVVEMVNGATVITPVDEAVISIVHDRLNTLGGLERDRLLGLNLDDVDRQESLAKNGQAAP
jgi:predicted ATPase